MRKTIFVKRMLWLLVLPVLFFACESEMDKHYEEPEWLKGSAWKILEDQGNYTTFLRGIERAGYRQIVDGKNIMTIMAPDDDAFAAYFAAHDPVVSSLDELSDEEVRKLIGFHLLYYSYSTDKLINFRPQGDGVSEEVTSVGAGMFYKHRTKSSDEISVAYDTLQTEYKIYHTERFLPVFSYRLFESLGVDAKTNYEYFYPNSTWTGDQSFNVSNASVVGEEVITGNGYLYQIDQVLEPLETIYTELKNNPEYSDFLTLYDKYSYFLYDAEASTEYGNGDSLFYHKHLAPLADIACEWPVNDYTQIAMLSSFTNSVFAPSNAALRDVFNSYWREGEYTSLNEVSPTALAYLIRNCSFSDIVFPEAVKSGEVTNTYGSVVDFDVDAIPAGNRKVCSNGFLYELTSLKMPPMFTAVTGPAYKYKDLSHYLYMLDASGMAVALSSGETNFTMLMPSNAQIEEMGYVMLNGVLSDSGDEFAALKTSSMINYVNLHTVTGGQGIATSGTQVLETNSPRNYWFVKNNKITTSALFNQILEASIGSEPDPFFEISEIPGDWSNGKAYRYEREELLEPLQTSQSLARLLFTNDRTYKYYYFSQLLSKAELLDATNGVTAGGLRNLYFIPTNEAFQQALNENKIPGVTGTDVSNLEWDGDSEEAKNRLQMYMMRYIVNASSSSVGYPYVGSGINGFYNTPLILSDGQATLRIVDDGSKLTVTPAVGAVATGSPVEVVDTYDYFPFAYSDGCVHFLKDVFTFE